MEKLYVTLDTQDNLGYVIAGKELTIGEDVSADFGIIQVTKHGKEIIPLREVTKFVLIYNGGTVYVGVINDVYSVAQYSTPMKDDKFFVKHKGACVGRVGSKVIIDLEPKVIGDSHIIVDGGNDNGVKRVSRAESSKVFQVFGA